MLAWPKRGRWNEVPSWRMMVMDLKLYNSCENRVMYKDVMLSWDSRYWSRYISSPES